MLDGDRPPEAVAARFAVPHFVLVVVVPGRVDAHLQQLLRDALLPPAHRRRVGEVEVRSLVIPEAGTLGCVALRIADKQPLRRHRLILRVILQQARLDVSRQPETGVVKRLAQLLGLRHLVVIPVEHVALVVDRGVARRQLEGVAGNGVLTAQRDELLQLLLGVRRVGVVHGRTAVAQAPLRPEVGAAGQAHEGLGDVQYLRPEEQVVIQIARFGLIAAIGRVVVVDLVAQIQPAAAQVVVKQAEARLRPTGNGERNVFVQRIGAGGVVAHGVQVTHLEAAAGALQIAGFLPQAVITLIGKTPLVVRHAIAVRIEQVGAGRPVRRQRPPFAGGVAVLPFQPQRLMHRHAQPRRADHQPIALLAQLIARQAETGDAEPIAPLPGHILLRRDAPGAIQRQPALTFDQHAEQIVFQHVQAETVAFIDQQLNVVGMLRRQRPVFQGFHKHST